MPMAPKFICLDRTLLSPGDQVFVFDSAAKRYDLYYFDDFESRWVPSPPPIRPGSAFCVFKQKAADWVETFSIRGY